MAEPRKRWKVAAVQMTSTTDVEANRLRARTLIRRAAARGADLVAVPENFAYLRPEGTRIDYSQPLGGDLVESFREEARLLRCHLLLGSIPERIPRSRRVYNTSVLIGPDGEILATYRKMHLFDINIKGGAVFEESRTVNPGPAPVVIDTELGCLGLSICYDLRFPEYYRQLALGGARVLFVPAAFTAYTGPPHWRPLLRARAIENQCWVVAPAQVGHHGSGRRSHGETLVVDPWGKVVARRLRGDGVVEATIDFRALEKVRRGLPCLEHVRKELLPPQKKLRGRKTRRL